MVYETFSFLIQSFNDINDKLNNLENTSEKVSSSSSNKGKNPKHDEKESDMEKHEGSKYSEEESDTFRDFNYRSPRRSKPKE